MDRLLLILKIILLLLYVLIVFKVAFINPLYTDYINIIITLYISIFLMYTYRPFWNNSNNIKVDNNIIFQAGVYLFLTTSIGSSIKFLAESNLCKIYNNFQHGISSYKLCKF